eukprot:scaffold444029_cov18-Prasinocladus_malaysianus.AAC.1
MESKSSVGMHIMEHWDPWMASGPRVLHVKIPMALQHRACNHLSSAQLEAVSEQEKYNKVLRADLIVVL